PLEPVERDTQRRVELALAAQRLGEPQEHEALRILGELGGEGAHVVSHASPFPGRRAPRRARAARRTGGSAPRPNVPPAAPTGPSSRWLRRSAPAPRARIRAAGARARATDRGAARGAARRRPRGARPGRNAGGRGAGARSDRVAASPRPARRRRAPRRSPAAAVPARLWPRAPPLRRPPWAGRAW